VCTRVLEHADDLCAFESERRTLGIVLVVGVGGVDRRHDGVERLAEMGDATPSVLTFTLDGRPRLVRTHPTTVVKLNWVVLAADAFAMQVEVLGAGFLFGVIAFVAWLLVMLRHERTHRMQPLATFPPPTAAVVRAGSLCRVPGNVGRSKNGTVLVCGANDHGRPRWRRA
jgi:hypothetical protein